MSSTTRLVQNLVPFILLAGVALGAVQLCLQLGISLTSVANALHQAAPYLLGLAAITFAVAFASLSFESWAGVTRNTRSKKGLAMDVLRRLTNREALEALLAQQAPVVIDADALAAKLQSRVIGQDGVCADMAAQIRRRLALQVRGKPVGVFLLAGPPGTGKTWLAKQLAEALGRKLLHLDMTQFSAPHAATQLFGSPKGYVGSDSYGRLTRGLLETPDAVVLLDEIEKAHPDVLKKFLTAWNDGHVTEASNGRSISTSQALFVLTSNAATDELAAVTKTTSDADMLRQSAVDILRRSGFAPEVLNRIDRIFVFQPLTGLDIARVAALEIEQTIQSYGLQVAEGGIDPQLLFQIMQRQERLGPAASARDITRMIEEQVSDHLITARQERATRVRLIQDGPSIKVESVR